MRNINEVKRKASVKEAAKLWGNERAEYLMYEGWAILYIALQKEGLAWSERNHQWHKSRRPSTASKKSVKPIKRYDYARITFMCAVADIEVVVEQWRQLIDLVSYQVWRVENSDDLSTAENVRVTVFARREV